MSAPRVGIWIVGARGSVATCIAYGLAGLQDDRIEPIGMVTSGPEFRGLGLLSPGRMVFGGHEIREGSLVDNGLQLCDQGILTRELYDQASARVAEFEKNIRPGILEPSEERVLETNGSANVLRGLDPLQRVEQLRADLVAFRATHDLERVVVVHLASAEARVELPESCSGAAAFLDALKQGVEFPASVLYAYAALTNDCPYVNFTPSPGASPPALQEVALERGVPHCGQDAKTGETLLKTVLAPMFVRRRLRVASWVGYNILGNHDGQVLEDPEHKAAKLRNKDEPLRQILGDDEMTTRVGIDYVPSIGDWKTAWDNVHFEGFLGARMSLQFTWQGSDSALAAPLVLDLVRLVELAARRGEKGAFRPAAPFFKSPLGVTEQDFFVQHQMLDRWCREVRAEAAARAGQRPV